ncbi:MAG: hypothetical protein JWL63_2598 [Rhodocyclales bacterium]|nr:hypothetical protein [Rhodocyclales bacterium]
MLSANKIPDLVGISPQDVRAWWDQILELGLNIHPDDDLRGIVQADSHTRALDESACSKIAETYQRMFELVGDSTYEIGLAAQMYWLGYIENPLATPENGVDFWVRVVQ